MMDFEYLMEAIGYVVMGMITAIIVISVIGLALWILQIIGQYKAFQKAGQQGYTGLIPMVDEFVMGQLSGARKDTMILLLMKTFGALLGLIPFVGWIAYIIVVLIFECKQRYAVSKSFGYDVGMTVLLVLLPFIGWMIIGCGGSVYRGPSKQE